MDLVFSFSEYLSLTQVGPYRFALQVDFQLMYETSILSDLTSTFTPLVDVPPVSLCPGYPSPLPRHPL